MELLCVKIKKQEKSLHTAPPAVKRDAEPQFEAECYVIPFYSTNKQSKYSCILYNTQHAGKKTIILAVLLHFDQPPREQRR